MKTKSKRFLNLATLCLALLGTALLMGRPVKAEVEGQSISTEQTEMKRRYMDKTGIGEQELEQKHGKDRFQGYLDGYKKGLEEPNVPKWSDIEVPDGREDDYRDGYEQGFVEGRHEAYPVTAFLEDLWGFLTNVFGGWFGENQ
ncbi:hypothetical protein HMPREF1241_0472 [Streptococcus pyogenes GA03799]|uniref:hypothetical protein n=1 Tax=Streptococcus pyogenes TaxID=1314 RepID=UPI0003C7CA08|nr:hypothetical protein [Streptococcus pyogenes]ESU87614.1 hypothetical protein HMPREF1241_0472 [Streptococcus pyogenes GA03799]SQG14937.1 hypothetical membrane associated protein [Streptococcus pyogenes]